MSIDCRQLSSLLPRCSVSVFFFLGTISVGAKSQSISFEKRKVLNVGVNVLRVDLNDPTVKVTAELSAGFPGRDEPFASMVKRSHAVAAITGTFFSTTSLYPVGDIVIDGRLRYFGGMGSALAITPTNEVIFHQVPYGRRQEWKDFETVIASGPMLLQNGVINLNPRDEHFSDPRVLGRATRAAIGWTDQNKLVWVAIRQPLTLRELAKILQRLGCINAVNLDGGSSTALYYRGKVIVKPERRLVNIVTVRSGVPQSLRFAVGETEEEVHGSKRFEYAATQFERGEADNLRKDWEGAIDHYRTASSLAPDNASYFLALAKVLNVVGRQAERSTALAEAGRAYLAKELYAEAGEQFRRTLHLNPMDIPTRRLLAQALDALGDKPAAAAQSQQIDSLQLAMTTPLSRPESVRRLEASITMPPPIHVKARPSTPELRGKFWKSENLRGIKGHFQAARWDFRLQLREDWRFKQSTDKTALFLENPRQHFQGILRVFQVSDSVALQSFMSKYHTGQFHVTESSKVFKQDGAYGIEDRCHTIVAGELLTNRCVVIRRPGYILALSLSAKQVVKKQADREFNAIIEHLKFR